ncbi:Transposon Ty3-I Gag-Pol polyprotein [Gossypium australe]|uniref:Transposon Ty3-I Gag-Pol polyprotein n=1 Tax=Gossypium australe TaxID=47621 RepID=A0A5B6UTH9_9ROSI|nr:Transposon Ty3-I Gag-Pol polyprotein [Gossypium australe]
MPFGLTNAPSSFQSLMNSIFRNLLRRSVLVFFYDILVYSPRWEDHLFHLREVLQVLRSHQLYAKRSKCVFGATQVEYLGHVISQGVVSMDQERVVGVLDWPPPKSGKELHGFLGLSGYYRKFIKGYGQMVQPLTTLLKKDVVWNWLELEQNGFDQLKTAICHAPVLALPNFQEPFCVETDASGIGVGAILQHKALCVKYQIMSIYDKEMMIVLLAVKKWHTLSNW